jgi:hypothetical protein
MALATRLVVADVGDDAAHLIGSGLFRAPLAPRTAQIYSCGQDRPRVRISASAPWTLPEGPGCWTYSMHV